MGPWRTLWLWFSLHRVLRAQDSGLVQAQSQPREFHSEKFQGVWFVLGLAGNSYKKQDRTMLNPYTTVFELKNNSHFEVSNSMIRGQRCDTWSSLMMPTSQPARFTVDHGGCAGPGTNIEQIQVVDTNYTSFALLMSRRQATDQPILRISLLGRTWTLPPGTPDKFICLTKEQNLTEDNVVF
uniref:Lipocalin/cytosolic fatty-acid binding domain-containing protein n=1 Tax=Cavia porcellus TaxID=10141 RepID=H0W4F3_CAVPO